MNDAGKMFVIAALATTQLAAGKPGELILKAPPVPVESVNSAEMNRLQNAMILKMANDIRLLRSRLAYLENRFPGVAKKGIKSTLPLPVMGDEGAIYVVKSYGANVRTGPSMNYPVLRQHRRNDLVLVIEEKNGWYRLSPEGWIHSKIVAPAVRTALSDAFGDEGAIYVVKSYGANVRTGPSMNYPVLRQHRRNDLVLVIEEKNGWYRLSPEGWIHSKIVAPAVRTASPEDAEKGRS